MRGPAPPRGWSCRSRRWRGRRLRAAFRIEPPALVEFGSETSEPTRWETVARRPRGDRQRPDARGVDERPAGRRLTLFVGETLAWPRRSGSRAPAASRTRASTGWSSDGRRIVVVADGITVATATAFEMDVGIRVELDGEPFFDRAWREVIPRDLL